MKSISHLTRACRKSNYIFSFCATVGEFWRTIEPQCPEQAIQLCLKSVLVWTAPVQLQSLFSPWFLGVCCVVVQFCRREMEVKWLFLKPNSLLSDRTQVQSYSYFWLLVIRRRCCRHMCLFSCVPCCVVLLLSESPSRKTCFGPVTSACYCFLHGAHILNIYNSNIFRKKWQFLFCKIKSKMTCVNYSFSLTCLPGHILLRGF